MALSHGVRQPRCWGSWLRGSQRWFRLADAASGPSLPIHSGTELPTPHACLMLQGQAANMLIQSASELLAEAEKLAAEGGADGAAANGKAEVEVREGGREGGLRFGSSGGGSAALRNCQVDPASSLHGPLHGMLGNVPLVCRRRRPPRQSPPPASSTPRARRRAAPAPAPAARTTLRRR